MITWLHHLSRWHQLASAHPGGLITTNCGIALPYAPLMISTGYLRRGDACEECRPAAQRSDETEPMVKVEL